MNTTAQLTPAGDFPRWGRIGPPRYKNERGEGVDGWPQDTLRIPSAGARFTPPVYKGNADIDRQESFTMSGTFNLGAATVAGQVFNLTIPTEQDGDFWCDQIYMVGWFSASDSSNWRPFPSEITIRDLRTGNAFNYPGGVPTEHFMTFQLFYDNAGFDAGGSPYPDGFRSTATLPQPICFTRQGGIQLSLTTPVALTFAAGVGVIDIAFGGWKEYTYASR